MHDLDFASFVQSPVARGYPFELAIPPGHAVSGASFWWIRRAVATRIAAKGLEMFEIGRPVGNPGIHDSASLFINTVRLR